LKIWRNMVLDGWIQNLLGDVHFKYIQHLIPKFEGLLGSSNSFLNCTYINMIMSSTNYLYCYFFNLGAHVVFAIYFLVTLITNQPNVLGMSFLFPSKHMIFINNLDTSKDIILAKKIGNDNLCFCFNWGFKFLISFSMSHECL
jgi:hypothetical protein